jgi:hypothetical protein
MDTVEREMVAMGSRISSQEARLLDIETEGKVQRASLSRMDRLLVILIPALVSLAGIILTQYLASPASAGMPTP